MIKKLYDVMWDGAKSSGPTKVTDNRMSKEMLIDIMMKKYGITNSDLDDISIVRSKIRDINIDEILKDK